MKVYWILLRDRLASIHPNWLRAGGMLGVAGVLLVASTAFGLFGSGYEIDGAYNQLYPAGSSTPQPTTTPVTSLVPAAWDRYLAP